MAYKVITTSWAEDDARQVVYYIAKTSPIAALRWLNGLRETMGHLEEFPLRFASVSNIENSCRACPYHTHRIIYRVDESSKTIYILRVYHSAREPLKEDDLS